MKIVFLVEERSMAKFLEILLPRLLPSNVCTQVIPHEGKSDLERSIPRKLKGWREPDVRFVIMRDNDSGNCISLKERYANICKENNRSNTLIRIVCQELESWYLGDLRAVCNAYNLSSLANKQRRRQYRDPDIISSPSEKIKKLVPGFSIIDGAQKIAQHLDINANLSHSFQVFIQGINNLISGNINTI